MEIPVELIQSLMSSQHSGLAANVLLFMIFISSRKTAKAVDKLSVSLTRLEISHELRIENLERIVQELKTK